MVGWCGGRCGWQWKCGIHGELVRNLLVIGILHLLPEEPVRMKLAADALAAGSLGFLGSAGELVKVVKKWSVIEYVSQFSEPMLAVEELMLSF